MGRSSKGRAPCLAALALSLATQLACERDRETARRRAPKPALRVLDLTIDAANQPRDGGPLIAGEAVRVGLRIRGGAPPYRVSLQTTPSIAGERAIDASVKVNPDEPDAAGVEVAARAAIAARAASGAYGLSATVTDAAGSRATAAIHGVSILGEGEALLPAPAASPFVEVLDAGGRRRQVFVRGEPLTLRARFGSPSAAVASVRIRDPEGALAADSDGVALAPDGRLSLSFSVPRLAPPGTYAVEVTAGAAPPATASFRVSARRFAKVARLVVDELNLWGGEDRRTLRRGRLRRGEILVVEARVGGARGEAEAFAALSGSERIRIARERVVAPAPDRRIFLRGEWQVPSTIPPGRARIEVEVIDGEQVSTRYREVLIE